MNLHKILLLICCFIFLSFTTNKKHEKTKTIHRNYDVNKNATVYVNNKYGNVSITTWDKNKVEITVKITVKGNDYGKVDEKLDAITINFENSKDLIEARTQIENSSSNWSWWGNSSKVNYKINYFIKMPKTNHTDLHNKYGEISINELDGKTNIKCDYGNIQIDNLSNESNTIELNYCGNSEIGYIKSGNIQADYSKLTINKSESLKSNTDYTSLNIGKVDDLSFSCDYGDITVKEVINISGNSDYASMKFGTVYKNLKVNNKYGGIRINNLADNFENFVIDSRYASIKMGTSSTNSFNFNINLSYSNFKYPEEHVELSKSIKKTTKKHYEGLFGKDNLNSTINIKSEYGEVIMKLND